MSRSLRLRVESEPQVRMALRRNGYISQRLLAEDLGIAQSTVSNFLTCKPVDFSYFTEICEKLALSWRDIADLEVPLEEISTTTNLEAPVEVVSTPPTLLPIVDCLLEYPEGEVPLSSPFYVERAPVERYCYEEIKKPGSLIRIKAPQRMGKSSLLTRTLQEVERMGDVTVTIDFQLTGEEFFSNLNTFLHCFCASVSQELTKNDSELQLAMLRKLDEHWHLAERIGSMRACKDFFERYLLPEIKQSLTLGLETVDRLFEHPKIYKDFFGLLRSLHEESKRRDIWKKLRLVMVHSTEAYVPLDINQSPFNVGLSIELPEFTHEQVFDLAKRHKLDWSNAEVKSLVDMIGGHPFLVRLALYKIAKREISLHELLRTAPTAAGIYASHLQHQDSILHKQSELESAIREVASSNIPVLLKTAPRFKLHSMGLVKLQGSEVVPRCELYRQYYQGI
jgi:transcriptional regulator with XRE-family HTH domain